MKQLLVWTIVIAACAANTIPDPNGDLDGVDSFVHDPEALNLIDEQEPLYAEYERDAEDNEYLLYTRSTATVGQSFKFLDGDSVINSNFRLSRNIVILAHGHHGTGVDKMSTSLRDAFLAQDDVNVIVLDWRRLASRNYVSAKREIAAVGKNLGQLINWLVSSFGANYDRMHLVGFNLGAHVAGNAARETRSLVKRITALEPSTNLWARDPDRLTNTDAQYVEAIHTRSEQKKDVTDPIGDADFYPNGGDDQPGCFTNTCSHNRAVELMAASVIYDNLRANQCADKRQATRNRCFGPSYPMGNADLNKSRSGIFRVNTRWSFPFA